MMAPYECGNKLKTVLQSQIRLLDKIHYLPSTHSPLTASKVEARDICKTIRSVGSGSYT